MSDKDKFMEVATKFDVGSVDGATVRLTAGSSHINQRMRNRECDMVIVAVDYPVTVHLYENSDSFVRRLLLRGACCLIPKGVIYSYHFPSSFEVVFYHGVIVLHCFSVPAWHPDQHDMLGEVDSQRKPTRTYHVGIMQTTEIR